MNDGTFDARSYPSPNGPDPNGSAHPTVEQLSEYLDASPRERAANWQTIEGHLQSCSTCQAVLNDLQVMVQMLQSLPEIEAPQRFAVPVATDRPATVPAASEPINLQETPQWHIRHAAKVRWATAVVAALFVFVLSVDLVTNGLRPGITGTTNDEAPASVMMSEEADQTMMSVPDDAADGEPEQGEAEAELESEPPASQEGYLADIPEEEEESADARMDDAARSADSDEAAGEETFSTMAIELDDTAAREESEAKVRKADSGQTYWRIAQVGLAIILALLLAVLIGLPRQHSRRQP